MTTETLLLIVLIVFLIGAIPSWPYSRSWGYTPAGVLVILLVGYLVWVIAGSRPLFRGSSGNIETTIQNAGQDLKAAGRDVADSVRDAVN
jgi:uncharacterized membrane protein